jgi:AraC-like DNA-binding protein
MKLIYKRINNPLSEKVSVRIRNTPCYDPHWHYHEELELLYCKKGDGIRFIGDNIGLFSEGELVLVGSNIPHLWCNNPEDLNSGKVDYTELHIIHFHENFLGKDFIDSAEASQIRNLLKLAECGILFTGDVKEKAIEHIYKLPELSAFDKILELLELLNLLSKSNNYRLLSGSDFRFSCDLTENSRLKKIELYLFEHFRDAIKLSEISEIAHMSPNAFCRYFKKHMDRTLFEFISELRISHACREIIKNEKGISEICKESGYRSETLFNRHFKRIMKLSPTAYRRIHLSREPISPASKKDHKSTVQPSC